MLKNVYLYPDILDNTMRLQQQNFLLTTLIASTINILNAQWIPTNGPMESWTFSLAVGISKTGDTNLYAGSAMGCVFLSTNRGDTWTEIDGGTWWVIP